MQHVHTHDSTSFSCRRLRWVRTYAFMLRAPANFGFLPVERKQVSDDPGIDTPMFDWAWSDSSATTGMASVRVRSHRRRFGRAWDYYDIFYAIPDRPISPNEALRAIPRIPSFWGDIIVVRRDPKGVRLLDMRDRDVPKVTSAVRMVVRVITTGENMRRFYGL